MNSSEERFDGSLTPIPPNLAGSAKRLRSALLGGSLPVGVGITFVRNVVSNGSRHSPMSGVVRERDSSIYLLVCG